MLNVHREIVGECISFVTLHNNFVKKLFTDKGIIACKFVLMWHRCDPHTLAGNGV